MKFKVIAFTCVLLLSFGCNATEKPHTIGQQRNADNLIWVERTIGMQCEEELFYESMQDAIDEFETNNIEVYDSRETSYPVCLACSICPKSTFYQLQIDSLKLQEAKNLEWRKVEDEN